GTRHDTSPLGRQLRPQRLAQRRRPRLRRRHPGRPRRHRPRRVGMAHPWARPRRRRRPGSGPVSVATRELRRRPGRFAFVGIALALLSTLLLLLGGLLDGLVLGSTGAFRAQDAPVFVYSADAQDSFLRSRITRAERDQIAAAPGVTGTAGLGLTLDAGRLEGTTGTDNLLDLAVMGYEQGTDVLPAPPGP